MSAGILWTVPKPCKPTMLAVRAALLLSLTVTFLGLTASVAQASEVSIDVPNGVLHGMLLEPSGRAPYNVALLVSGSGRTDRNGNAPGLRNDPLKLLAGDSSCTESEVCGSIGAESAGVRPQRSMRTTL